MTWLVISITLLITSLVIHGQSGETLTPIQTPIPKVIESRKYDTKSDFLLDVNAEKYKLVFAPNYEGKLIFSWKEDVEWKRSRQSHFNNFVEQLNKAGELGYKLVSASGSDLALLKLETRRNSV